MPSGNRQRSKRKEVWLYPEIWVAVKTYMSMKKCSFTDFVDEAFCLLLAKHGLLGEEIKRREMRGRPPKEVSEGKKALLLAATRDRPLTNEEIDFVIKWLPEHNYTREQLSRQ